jgi:alanine-glyoxylate transaminase/serine-glyoxylate transaminase/serine-pyruvate transaminase
VPDATTTDRARGRPVTDRLLLGPGPSNPYPEAVAALTRPLLGHMDPEFLALLDDTMARLRVVFRTGNQLTLPVSGTGSAGMETCFVNLVEPGDTAIVGANGVFGDRMCEVARRCGADVVRVEEEWGRPLDPQRLLDAQRANPHARVLAVVHAETSTGVENTVAPLSALRDTDTLLLVDTVTSLGGIPVEVDAWGVDASYSGTQKCLGVPPGLSPVTFSERAVARLQARRTPVQSWYLDLSLIAGYVSGAARVYHHTAPVAMVFSLHAALGALLDEGLEAAWARHRAVGNRLQRELPELGFRLVVDDGHRLPELTTAWLPDGADDARLRAALLGTYGIEVGGGLGAFAGKAWRIGLMGHSARERSVTTLLGALRDLL